MTGPEDAVRIVVTYPDGELPSQAFQAVQRSRRALRRAGYQARIDLVPASGGGAAVGTFGGELLHAGSTLGADLDALIERLSSSGRLLRGPEPSRSVAVHRGLRPVGERARLPE